MSPNGHKPIVNTDETLQSRYEETQARLQKIRDAGYKVLGCESKIHLCDNPDHKNELGSQPYVKHSPINIRDAFTGLEPRPRKYTRVKQGEQTRYVDIISLYPTFVSTANSLQVTRKCMWVQTLSLTVWIGMG